MFENVDGRTDGRRTDGRTTDARVTGILIAHLGAFGSGELKKQLKSNVCIPKSNSNDWYAMPFKVIAYHLVHFNSIWVINKCQSGIFFFTSERKITPVL